MSEYLMNQNGASFSAPVKPRPLNGEITMTGYDIGTVADSASRSQGVFDGRYLWINPGYQGSEIYNLTQIDVAVGTQKDFPIQNGVNGNTGIVDGYSISSTGSCAFDDKNIWYLPINGTITQFNVFQNVMTGYSKDNGINGNENIPEKNSTFCSVYDGANIWYLCSEGDALVKLNPQTGTMTGYTLEGVEKSPSIAVVSMAYDGKNIWFVSGAGIAKLYKVDLSDLSVIAYSLEDLSSEISISEIRYWMTYDGSSIWMSPLKSNKRTHNSILKFCPGTESFVVFPLTEGVNNNVNMGNSPTLDVNLFYKAQFDGKYIWLAPASINRLLRIHTGTGTVRGFDLQGDNLGNINQKNNQFISITYDGKNLWLIPNRSNRLVKVSPAEDNTLALTEEYVDQNGTPIKPGCIRWLDPGDNYSETAPVIQGYIRAGHKIDGGALNASITASIPDVQSDHVVTFIYEVGEEELDTFTITQLYQMDDGTALLPTDFATVGEGGTYSKAAPTISGYRYMGYQIDNGAVESGLTASIYNVASDHTVTFLYKPAVDGDPYTITESYINLMDGSTIQPDTFTQVPAGGSYSKAAPIINGYHRAGHRIDGGTNSTDLTAQISSASGNHKATFLYIPSDDEGDIEGGNCCCCGEMELRLKLPFGNNKEVLEELKELVQTVKGCSNSTCC